MVRVVIGVVGKVFCGREREVGIICLDGGRGKLYFERGEGWLLVG